VNLWNSFLIAVEMLRMHKLRAALTVLGIVIGVMAVTLIVMFSEGFRAYIRTEFGRLGTDTLFVFYDPGRRRPGESVGFVEGLKMADAEYLRTRARTIGIVSAYADLGAKQVRYGDRDVPDARVNGVDEHFLDLNRFRILQGRAFLRTDLDLRANVCILGTELRDRLFPNENPLGKRVILKGIVLEVVGVLEKFEFMGQSTEDMLLVPITTVQDKWLGGDRLAVILMRPKPGIRVDTAMQEVWELMMLRSQNRPVYRVDSRESVLNILGNIIRVAGIVLGGVAALSLLVGGIGVMNIMLVSVTERTREIGLRKAVGARRFHILVQFLVEAGVLCLAGGLIGMGLGWVLGHLVSWATRAADLLGGTGLVVAFPLWAALLAVAFSALVGMVFGIYPAYSAARLHPIEALRFE
jgi:putative ABC transport system permease protein